MIAILSTQTIAQTFTAGQSGQLDQVDLDLVKSNAPAPLSLELRNVSGGAPGTQVLASATVPASSVSGTLGFVPVSFSVPAAVTAGTQYAIVAYTASVSPNFYQWGDKSGNPYPSGGELVAFSSPPGTSWIPSTGYDTAFKTYVAPPSSSIPSQTGQRAAALRKCKKKHSQRARKRCRRRANRLPL